MTRWKRETLDIIGEDNIFRWGGEPSNEECRHALRRAVYKYQEFGKFKRSTNSAMSFGYLNDAEYKIRLFGEWQEWKRKGTRMNPWLHAHIVEHVANRVDMSRKYPPVPLP